MQTRYRLYRSTGFSVLVSLLYALLGLFGRSVETSSSSPNVLPVTRHASYTGKAYRYCMGKRETLRRQSKRSIGLYGGL